MQIIEFKPRVYFVKFENQYDMCMTMLRIHENTSEDHPFGKKVFTHKDYISWYKETFNGNYYRDVQAMCVDGYQIRAFIRKFGIENMTKNEGHLVKILDNFLPKELLNTNRKFSVICTYHGENSIDFKHELAHALFYMDKEYKLAVKALFKKISRVAKKEMFTSLKTLDYDGDYTYMVDESNARLASEYSLDGGFKKSIHIKDDLINQLKTLLQEKIGS